jgi:hypothetical protein
MLGPSLLSARSGHRQEIETPKALKYVARETLDVRRTGLRRALPRH